MCPVLFIEPLLWLFYCGFDPQSNHGAKTTEGVKLGELSLLKCVLSNFLSTLYSWSILNKRPINQDLAYSVLRRGKAVGEKCSTLRAPVPNIPELHLCVIRRADIPNMIYHCIPPSMEPGYTGYWIEKKATEKVVMIWIYIFSDNINRIDRLSVLVVDYALPAFKKVVVMIAQ